jgi:uncharacterized protein
MKIVVDTNILLPSLSPRSPMHWLFADIISEKLTLCVTTDILNEYAEIIERRINSRVSIAVMDVLSTIPNILHVHKYYFWQAIEQDPDDNKFLDCAIAANAKYLITNDNHFKSLRKKPLFEVDIVTFDMFQKVYIQ